MTDLTEIDALLARVPEGHTPGPWWTAARYNGREMGCAIIAARIDAGPLPGNPTRGMVAHASAILNTDARRCEANAALIALSPDLATAALALRAEVSRLTAEREQDAAAIAELTRERDAAREALAATRKWIDAADQVGASGSFYYSDNVEAILELIDAAAAAPSPTTKQEKI